MTTQQTIDGITFHLFPATRSVRAYWHASHGPEDHRVYGSVDVDTTQPYCLYNWSASNYRAHRFPRGCERTLAAALAQCAQTMLEIQRARRIQ